MESNVADLLMDLNIRKYPVTVAIGMIGCKRSKLRFMRGYNAMLEKIEPSKIICFGTPLPEMDGNIITVDYAESRKAVG